jgi:hypothetical protein
MGNTCQLPLLTPTIPEIGARRAKSATAGDFSAPMRALFSTNYRVSPQHVHSRALLSGCRNRWFGCKVEDRRELPAIDCNL